MSRKQQIKEAFVNDTELEPIAEPRPPLNELEKATVQEQIMKPASLKIVFDEFNEIHLPYQFSLKDIFRNKIIMALNSFYLQMYTELKIMRRGRELDAEEETSFLIAILLSPSIQDSLGTLLSLVTKKPASFFEGKLTRNVALEVFRWICDMLKESESGNSQAKN